MHPSAQLDHRMLHQALPHTRQLGDNGYPHCGQVRPRADTREQEQLRRLDGACAQNHAHQGPHRVKLALAKEARARAAATFEVQPHAQGTGQQAHGVRPLTQRRVQEGTRRVEPNPVALGDLGPAGTFKVLAIEVIGPGPLGSPHGLRAGLRQSVAGAGEGHGQRPATSTPGVVANARAFQLLKQRQQVGVAPTGVARIAPGVEVLRRAAHVDGPVDGAGATHHTPCSPAFRPALKARVGLADVLPVVGRPAVHPFGGGRHPGAQGVVGATGFQHQDRAVLVRRQTTRQGAPRGASPDDEVVHGEAGQVGAPARRSRSSAGRVMPSSLNLARSAVGTQPSCCWARSAQ